MFGTVDLPGNHSHFRFGGFLLLFQKLKKVGNGQEKFKSVFFTSLKHRISCHYYKQQNALFPSLVKEQTSYMQLVYLPERAFVLQQLLIAVHDSWHTTLVLLS